MEQEIGVDPRRPNRLTPSRAGRGTGVWGGPSRAGRNRSVGGPSPKPKAASPRARRFVAYAGSGPTAYLAVPCINILIALLCAGSSLVIVTVAFDLPFLVGE